MMINIQVMLTTQSEPAEQTGRDSCHLGQVALREMIAGFTILIWRSWSELFNIQEIYLHLSYMQNSFNACNPGKESLGEGL